MESNDNKDLIVAENNNDQTKEKYIKIPKWKPDDQNDNTKEKISHPKRKYAIIHGYNGHDFFGNQKY